MIKCVKVVQRKPGLSPEHFQQNWLNVNGPLVAPISAIMRYERSYPAEDLRHIEGRARL